jgi:beta-glucosidase/6-phospho-beta-glucosidase/beta-galactosidase/ABC-type amino acid transport substrate-binding protein
MFSASHPRNKLPESFLFGVGNSDHQCEAYDQLFEDIRDVWERLRMQTLRGQATDFWNRYKEDVMLARELGCKMFRFSVSWARVEPQPGQFNQNALDHYRLIAETIRAAGMEPMVTLHHFTWPIHIEAGGGMISEDFASAFARYADEVAKAMGQTVRYWITFNEPNLLPFGYVKPWWERDYFMPPGMPEGTPLDAQMAAVAQLIRNLFLAHTAARAVIRKINPDAAIGANPTLLGLPPWLQRLVDRNATRLRSLDEFTSQGSHIAERGLLAKGDVDVVVATLTMTDERAQEVDFTEAYFLAGQALLVLATSEFNELENLSGQFVVVVKSSTAESSVRLLLPLLKVRTANDHAEALRVLNEGKAAALLTDDTYLFGFIQAHPGKYRIVGGRLTNEPYGCAITKGNRRVLDAVNCAVRRFIESGMWAESFARHFPGQPLPRLPEVAPRTTLADLSGRESATHDGGPLLLARRGTLLRKIQDRGYLTVAVKENVPGFGYRDPRTGELSGLEIDLARAIAGFIFGDSTKIRFRIAKTTERIPLLRTFVQLLDPILKPLSILTTALTSNWWHLGMAGKLKRFLCPDACVGQQDFIGIDYYWGISTLRFDRILGLIRALTSGQFTTAPVYPGALFGMLQFHSALFPDQSIFVVENGSVDVADNIQRAEYISRHIREVQRAHAAGSKIAGYLCWSITSNREWGLTFDPNSDFGLYHIELDTDPGLTRVPTPAVTAYQQIIARRGAKE